MESEYIRVSCFTNLDEYKQESWPGKMSCRPNPGDWVMAKSGKILTVVKITHMLDRDDNSMLRVELHRGV
jgi:hypothetical protein